MGYASRTHYYLGFNLVSGIGYTRLTRLIERCGSIEAAWHAGSSELVSAGIDAKSSAALMKARISLDLDAEMERLEQSGTHLVTVEDDNYPRLLGQVATPPPLLYVRGALIPEDDWAMAIVGTRSPTSYGKEAARHIVTGLAQSGLTIVSGLAVGIDTVAHTVALESGGRTIAVLGCGVDVIYPDRNKHLAEQIIQNGAIISEYPMQTRPNAINFPPRNRIISGLSLGTLIVEAREKSGALITKEFALEQGRDVFAVPGSIFNQTSGGTHRLIKDGAGLVTCAEDILDALNLTTLSTHQEMAATLPDDPTEAMLMEHLSHEPLHVDVLCRASGLPTAVVSATLAMMELKGYVRQVGAMEYVRR